MPAAKGELKCYGSALPDLEIRCMFGATFILPVDGREDPQELIFSQPMVSAPGEGYLLSWKRRSTEAIIVELAAVEDVVPRRRDAR
jgi:hypothetical protein